MSLIFLPFMRLEITHSSAVRLFCSAGRAVIVLPSPRLSKGPEGGLLPRWATTNTECKNDQGRGLCMPVRVCASLCKPGPRSSYQIAIERQPKDELVIPNTVASYRNAAPHQIRTRCSGARKS